MKLKSFVIYASSTIVGLFLLRYALRGTSVRLSPEAPKEPVHSGSPLSDTVRSALEEPNAEAVLSRPFVVENRLGLVRGHGSSRIVVRKWAYTIDKEKNEVVEKVEPTDEEISKLPSTLELYSFLRTKFNQGNTLSETEMCLYKAWTSVFNTAFNGAQEPNN